MPPRTAPRRAGPREGGNSPHGDRIDGAGRGGKPGGPSTAAHVETVGFKRPGIGNAGTPFGVYVNAFEATVPESCIFHYDVVEPEKLPAKFNLELITLLQTQYEDIFVSKVVYDGRKNIFSPQELALGDSQSRQFPVTLPQATEGVEGQAAQPRVYRIKLTKVSIINPEVLLRYIKGQKSHDETVLTSVMALNVVLRMAPNLQYPFNKRSFFMPREQQAIGGGMVLWRGIFQSVRPTIGRMIVNVDLATGTMYKEGPLLNLCLEFLEIGPNDRKRELYLSPNNGLQDYHRLRLQEFLVGLRVLVRSTGDKSRVIRGLSLQSAKAILFPTRAGSQVTVAEHFKSLGMPLQFPTIICAQIGSTAMVPLEFCTVLPGQIIRKRIPDAKVKDVLKFTTKRPWEKLESIKQGLDSVNCIGSEYLKSFGMSIDSTPIAPMGRVLAHPQLNYAPESKAPKITKNDIKNGGWNMVDKKFLKAAVIEGWIVIVYESQSYFPLKALHGMVEKFLAACARVGITVTNKGPLIKYHDGQQNIMEHLSDAGRELYNQFGLEPSLFLVVLPNVGSDIYTTVKHFGDVTMGVATQCLKSYKCKGANDQYWNNIMLKVNVKLGGINLVLANTSMFNDPAAATIVMGADVRHPAPGTTDRPSITAVVGSVDPHGAKYVATSHVQTGRQEIIADLKDMCKHVLTQFMDYRKKMKSCQNPKPVRLIFYRDGVSEGQFQQVKDLELPLIKAACAELDINPNITLIIVGKRHHIQFTPKDNQKVNASGNCPAGLVVDTDVVLDFYLLSHAGLLGTSRPAHYSVLYDDNKFNADTMQAFSFALCHVYARSTRSVSIPAPVYYADIVCSRAQNHLDPETRLNLSDASTRVSGSENYLETFQKSYKPLHPKQQKLMYFS